MLINVEDRFSTECFCCLRYRGPLCLLRVELGVLTNGRLGTVELVSEYIKHEQAEEVPNITFYYGFWSGGGAELEFQEICLSYFSEV